MNTLLLSLLVFQNITTYFDNFKNSGIIERNGGEIKYISENVVGSININGLRRQLNDDIENAKYNFNSNKYYYDSNIHKDYYDANEYDRKISFLETDEYDEEPDNEKDDDNENEESFLETDEYDEEADNENDDDNEHEESFLETDEYDEEADNENDDDNEFEESFLETDEYDEEADNENDDDNEHEESFLETDEYDEEADNEKDDDNENEESFLETDEYGEEADNENDDDNEHEESFLETDEYDEEADNENDNNDFESDEDNYANDINSSTTAQSFIEKDDLYFDDFFDSEETIKDAVKKGSKNKNSNTSSRNDSTKNMIKKLNKTSNVEFKNKNSFNEEDNQYEFSGVKSETNKQSLRSPNKNGAQSNLKDIKDKNTQNNMGQINLEEYEITNDELPSDIMSEAYDALAPTLHKKEKSNNQSTKYKLKNNSSTKDPKYVPYKKGENSISPHIHADVYKKNKKMDEMLEQYEQELSNDDIMELEGHNEDTPVIAETEDHDGDDDSNEPNSGSISFLSSLTLIILGLIYIMN